MTAQKPTVAVYWLSSSLYLNITNQCSNNCWFCIRNFKQGVGGFNLKHIHEPSPTEIFAELEAALTKQRWNEVVFCGFGEPTTRLDVLLDVARWLKTHAPTLPLRLDTNGHGYVLNPGRDVAAELKAAGINSVSVSLNGHDAITYGENCRPKISDGFKMVLDFVAKTRRILDVEVSAVRMPENDLIQIKAVVTELDVPFRIRDYIPCFW
jgi:GTP 3',8-cyclase